ncbi:MAG: DNA translocase FtsK, partial [Patescibacteria group bacterium]
GPTVTRYTLKPAEGTKISRITSLNQDLALSLAAHPIRIEAPIPGKSLVGIEVPNKAAAVVRLGNLILYEDFQKSGLLTFALGRNVNGDPVFMNIEKLPHVLIAGATGSGKSIAIHSLIISLLYKNSPDMLKLILIDPKRVELSVYNGLPHLIAPVVMENKKAIGALRWVIQEMDRRYPLLQEAGSRDIASYNKNTSEKLPYIIVVIDELADLMATYGREVEGSIVRLAQMARATGIHLVVSTQRPSVEVITGLIKANITGRIALQVASQIDSRTILDSAGAEKLLGNGDLLLQSAEFSKPRRIQGCFITEEEIKKVVSFIIKNNEPAAETVAIPINGDEQGGPLPLFDRMDENGDDDELFDQAVQVVRQAQKASASLLQRRLKVGYARAARLLDIMEEREIVGPGDGAKPREVFITDEES